MVLNFARFGGTNGFQWYNDVWCYDPIPNAWITVDCIGYIPCPREGHAAALVGDVMYIFGGRTEEGIDLGDLAAFRITSSRWYTFENMGPSPSPRSEHSMAVHGKEVTVLAGEPSTPVSEVQDLDLVYVLDTSKIRYPADPQPIPQMQETPSGNRVTRDRRGSVGEREVQADPPNTEIIQMAPFSDSGYASTTNDKAGGKQSTRMTDHAQSAEDVRHRTPMEDAYLDLTSNTTEDDTEPDDSRTVYSDASSLPDLKNESYISEFADDLVSQLRYEKSDSQTI